ncbi:MAG: ATP-binding protein [Bacteroides sp.]|nr:ATP-binding protein [Bacteroides sp.]
MISTIDALSDGTVWISTQHFLQRYNLEEEKLGAYISEWQGTPKTVYQVYEDSRKNVWVIQWRGGLTRYDKQTDSFIPYPWPFPECPTCIIEDCTAPLYWIGTWDKGVVRFDPGTEKPEEMFVAQSSTNSSNARFSLTSKDILTQRVKGIAQDSTLNYIWVATRENLYAYKRDEQDELQPIETAAFLPPGKKLPNDVMSDRSGHIWVSGSYPYSFILSFQSQESFRHLLPAIEERTGFPAAPQHLAYENGHYWMWQKYTGLCFSHPDNNSVLISNNRRLLAFFEKARSREGIFTAANTSTVRSVQVTGSPLIESENTSTILFIHEKENRLQETPLATIPTRSGERIRTLHEDLPGNLWVGTTYHLLKYNPEREELETAWEKTGIVNAVAPSADGNVYIGTESNGFLVLFADSRKVRHHTGENFRNVTVAPDGRVWTGTQAGSLYCYDPGDDRFTAKTTECGLDGNAISAVRADSQGNIWILCDQKITVYHPENESLYIIRSSDPDVSMHNFQSLYEDEEGKMHIGGTGGVLVFPPLIPLRTESQTSPVVLIAIRVNGESRLSGYKPHHIILQPEERNLELFLSTFTPVARENIRYAFRHKRKGAPWNYLPENQNSIYLTELSKGSYEVEIKATDENGSWSDESMTILIDRQPAWYETWWAYTLYNLTLLVVGLWVLFRYIGYQKEKQRVAMEEKMAQIKYRFFTNVSHELRTPLTLVIAPLETLLKRVRDPEINEQLTSIHRNARGLLELVNQLLDFRRVEMKGEVLFLSWGDIHLFLHSIYENFRLITTEKSLKFSYETQLTGCELCFDHDKLRKILHNLLSNAIKFTGENGTIRVSLTREIKEKRAYAVIKVEDTGKGIPREKLATIFEHFKQVEEGDGRKGSGIGLNLVKEYVEMHQGEVRVESEPEKGSVFSVYIPMDLEASSTTGELPMESTAEPEEESKKKILIVEDNQEFRNYLKKELSRYYILYEAADGEEGERVALEKEPDLIITDLMMPQVSGFELCRRIKNNLSISHIPVILLTANNTFENERQGYKEGADAYIAKPFQWDILLLRIRNLLEQQSQHRQLFEKEIEIQPEQITISYVDEKFLKRTLALIEKNMGNSEYSIEELSREVGMSRVNLYRKLQSITGNTPTEFVKSVRLKKAAELLKEGKMSVVEVAYTVGFNTPSYFTKSFKKMFGVLPTQYTP